jgi:hypothetical protein
MLLMVKGAQQALYYAYSRLRAYQYAEVKSQEHRGMESKLKEKLQFFPLSLFSQRPK